MRSKSTAKAADPVEAETTAAFDASAQRHQLSLRSLMSLPHRQRLDLWLRSASALDDANGVVKRIPGYATLDASYAWRPKPALELSVVGRNLLQKRHTEFFPDNLPTQLMVVERGYYVKVKWEF